MQDQFENKLTMYEAVVSFLDGNSTKIASLTALTDALTNLKDIILSVKEKDVEANTSETGNATVKAGHKAALVDSATTIAAALFALGSVNGDDRLKQLASYTKSTFKNMRDTQLGIDANNIKNLADANAAELAGYGITPAMIAAFDTQVTTFDSSIGTRVMGSSKSTAAFKQVGVLFGEADVILNDQMDKIMEVFRTTDTQFYDEYHNNRQIIDLGVRHRNDEEENPVTPVTP